MTTIFGSREALEKHVPALQALLSGGKAEECKRIIQKQIRTAQLVETEAGSQRWKASSNGYLAKRYSNEFRIGRGASGYVTKSTMPTTHEDNVASTSSGASGEKKFTEQRYPRVFKTYAMDGDGDLWIFKRLRSRCRRAGFDELTNDILISSLLDKTYYCLRELEIMERGHSLAQEGVSKVHSVVFELCPQVPDRITALKEDEEGRENAEFVEEEIAMDDIAMDDISGDASGNKTLSFNANRYRVMVVLEIEELLVTLDDLQTKLGYEVCLNSTFRLDLLKSLAGTLKGLHESEYHISHEDIKQKNIMLSPHSLDGLSSSASGFSSQLAHTLKGRNQLQRDPAVSCGAIS